MNVKDWITALQGMPEDAEVYYYFGETGEWQSIYPELIGLDHEDFEAARKWSWVTVAEPRSYVSVKVDGEYYGTRLTE